MSRIRNTGKLAYFLLFLDPKWAKPVSDPGPLLFRTAPDPFYYQYKTVKKLMSVQLIRFARNLRVLHVVPKPIGKG
jgi:hypothetical protein